MTREQITPIDRMVDAFLNCETEPITIHTKGRYPTTTTKMLAAVRELEKIAKEPEHSPGSSVVHTWLKWLCDKREGKF